MCGREKYGMACSEGEKDGVNGSIPGPSSLFFGRRPSSNRARIATGQTWPIIPATHPSYFELGDCSCPRDVKSS